MGASAFKPRTPLPLALLEGAFPAKNYQSSEKTDVTFSRPFKPLPPCVCAFHARSSMKAANPRPNCPWAASRPPLPLLLRICPAGETLSLLLCNAKWAALLPQGLVKMLKLHQLALQAFFLSFPASLKPMQRQPAAATQQQTRASFETHHAAVVSRWELGQAQSFHGTRGQGEQGQGVTLCHT